jgi:hypothetical protein
MSVDTKCSEYLDNYREWALVRDAIAGEPAIKKRILTYLPRPSGLEECDWLGFVERPHWFGATGRTAHGLHGMIFSKKPVLVDCPDALKALLENVDLAGTHIDQLSADLVWDTLPTNWGGILVDYPTTGEGMDKATSEAQGNRAYAAHYCAESIINWRYEKRNNVKVLALVVLKEPYERSPLGDEFSTETNNRYRVLSLDENGNYAVRVYDDEASINMTAPIEGPYNPKINGKPFKYIPFFTLPGPAPEKSMLLDLAYENVGHFQKTADYENGLHYTGVPTPYATKQSQPMSNQIGPDGQPIPIPVHLGGSQFLFFPEAETVAYLEFEGAGLGQEDKAIQACEERMAILGARIISAEKKGVESAEAARIHRAGENAVLATFANNISRVLTQVIRLLGEWQGIAGAEDTTYSLNTDYDVSILNPQLLSALISARKNGDLPLEVIFSALQAGEIMPDSMDFAEFESAIEEEEAKRSEAAGEALARTAAAVAAKGGVV